MCKRYILSNVKQETVTSYFKFNLQKEIILYGIRKKLKLCKTKKKRR